MNNNNPRITIVTVCYNAIIDIECTIKSVINQKYSNIEYIIIDGGSTDGTVDIIKKYTDKISFWISEPDKGIYDAMNKGISVAQSDWINFMNAGDMFVDEFVVDKLFNNKLYSIETAGIYGDCYIKKRRQVIIEKAKPFWENKNYIHGKGFCHQSTFIRTNLAKSFLFDTSLNNSADFKQCFELYKRGYRFQYIQAPICFFDHINSYYIRHVGIVLKEDAQILGHYKTPLYYLAKFNIEFSLILDRIKWKIVKFIRRTNKETINKELGYMDISDVTNAKWIEK